MEYSLFIAEQVFDSIKKQYEQHDKTCQSIPHMWLGRHGGVSCFNEQSECDGCFVTFYWEGLTEYGTALINIYGDEWDEIEAHYCECCLRKLKNDNTVL